MHADIEQVKHLNPEGLLVTKFAIAAVIYRDNEALTRALLPCILAITLQQVAPSWSGHAAETKSFER